MADDDAERAFFQAQTQNADTVSYGAAGEQEADSSDSEEEYDPSRTAQIQYSAPLTDPDQSAMPNFPSFNGSSSTQRRSSSQDFSQALRNSDAFPSQTPSRNESRTSASVTPANTSSVQPQSQPQPVSGLVVEEDGDEDRGDAEYEPPAALSHVQDMASGSADIPQRFFSSQNANGNVSSSYHVSQQQTVPEQKFPQGVSSTTSSYPASSYVDTPPQNDGVSNGVVQDESKLHAFGSAQSSNQSSPLATAASRGRLPHDRVGILEDRIQADPRGDTDAWLELIEEHRTRNKFDSVREAYNRFFKVFPSAAEQWVAYASMESENSELYRLEQIFNKSLLSIPNVQLWSVYLDYVRRRNNLTTDTTGQARRIISSAYDFALQNIGIDKDSGSIWVDYIQFIRSGPGNIGGSDWQDQQKMDLLRKAYQRAICIPTQAVNTLWREYDQFEMGLNKLTGRKFLQERSPSYMTARSSYTELQNFTKDLVRTSLPKLPPVQGFEGYEEYQKQVEIWRRWIKWEKDDPLVLKDEDAAAYKARVLFVYRQALMAMRFLPELWFEAADYCFQNAMDNEGNDFLRQGIEANPESCLLAFKRADRLEITSESEQDNVKRGAKVREPYDKVLDALYSLISKAKAQEEKDIARVEENFAQAGNVQLPPPTNDDEEEGDEVKAREKAKTAQIDALKKAHAAQIGLLSKTVSFAWIALMRSMRRIQGKGKPGETPGSRQIFADARKRGRITSDVYIASALLEYHCYKDPAATKIFERGAKLFPDDENFTLEYLKHLIDINDITNARAVFETAVRRLASTPENAPKAKPIFSFLHEHESRYGDMVQITNLETRMRELFPEDPTLTHFTHRFATPQFNPIAFQPILSPSQTKPQVTVIVDRATSRQNSPAPRYVSGGATTDSPKRAFPLDEIDDDVMNRPRKFIRAESPLKGAAGRRLDQQKRNVNSAAGGSAGGAAGGAGGVTGSAPLLNPQPPPPLPREIVFLLSIIPNASSYDASRFSPEKMVNLIRGVDVPSSVSQLRLPPQGGQGPAPRVRY